MTRRLFVLVNERLREKAIEAISDAVASSRVDIKGPQRSTSQNSALWAMLTDLSEQLQWNGQTMTPDDFKIVMLDALRRYYGEEMRVVPNSDRSGWVQLDGRSSSDLSHDEMRDLLTIIRAFGDQHSVEWSEPKPKDDGRPTPPIEVYQEDLR